MLATSIVLALVCFVPSIHSPAAYRTSKVDITPTEPLPLGGYTARNGRKSEPGGEPLFARTIVFTSGPLRFAVVSAELLTIPESLASRVTARAGMPVFLAATHTHCAPDSQMLNDRMTFAIPGIARYDEKWLNWFSERIASGIHAAAAAPAKPLESLSRSMWRIELNRGRRRLANPDRSATLIRAGEQPLIFHYTAHAVFYGPERNQTSGDWPGKTERLAFLTLVGAIGDVSPASSGDSAAERIKSFWASQENAARQAPKKALNANPIAFASVPIQLPSELSWKPFANENRIPEPLARSIVERFAPKEANITAFRIGKLCVIGVPGEPTSELGRRIRYAGWAAGFETVLVCSHVNGWAGYILEPDDFARGGYEASLDFYGPNMAERVFAAARLAMRKLANHEALVHVEKFQKNGGPPIAGRQARK